MKTKAKHRNDVTEPLGSLTVDGPQPGWMTLDAARSAAFTGELVFTLDPEVRLYLDGGVVYFADREGDPSLGQRLVAHGLITMPELEGGTVRIGDVEHLGRLFDRVDTVDRDAVMVAVESWTEEITTELANWSIADVKVTAYRHHASGVHRWFAAPGQGVGTIAATQPLTSPDPATLPEIPSMPIADDAFDDLWIEWDEPNLGIGSIESLSLGEYGAAPVGEQLGFTIEVDDQPATESGGQETAPDELVVDVSDLVGDRDATGDATDDVELAPVEPPLAASDAVPIGDATDYELLEIVEALSANPEVHGAGELSAGLYDDVPPDSVDLVFDEETDVLFAAGSDGDEATGTHGDEAADPTARPEPFVVQWPTGQVDTVVPDNAAVGPDVAEDTGPTEIRFEFAPIDQGTPAESAPADVPSDVVDAVRRAIAAIEMASQPVPVIKVEPRPAAPVPFSWDRVDPDSADERSEAAEDRSSDEGTDATADDGHFEVSYGTPRTDARPDDPFARPPALSTAAPAVDVTPAIVPTLPSAGGGAGIGTGDDEDGGDDDRKGALRRLIGGLRRKS